MSVPDGAGVGKLAKQFEQLWACGKSDFLYQCRGAESLQTQQIVKITILAPSLILLTLAVFEFTILLALTSYQIFAFSCKG